MPETDAGLHLVQHDQHVDQCICPDLNEAPPPYAEACVAKQADMIVHALAIEAEARGAKPTVRPPWPTTQGRGTSEESYPTPGPGGAPCSAPGSRPVADRAAPRAGGGEGMSEPTTDSGRRVLRAVELVLHDAVGKGYLSDGPRKVLLAAIRDGLLGAEREARVISGEKGNNPPPSPPPDRG